MQVVGHIGERKSDRLKQSIGRPIGKPIAIDEGNGKAELFTLICNIGASYPIVNDSVSAFSDINLG